MIKNNILFLIISGDVLISNSTLVSSQDNSNLWLDLIPEISIIANIRTIYNVELIDSFSTIVKNDQFDGYVVICLAENIVDLAIQAELLNRLRKPIIFTGSRFTPESLATHDIKSLIKKGCLGLRSNIINAVQLAANPDFHRTAIVYGSRIIQPCKAEMNENFYAMNLFKSHDDTYLGSIDFGISFQKHDEKRSIEHVDSLSARVEVMDARYQDLGTVSLNSCDAVVVYLAHGMRIDDSIIRSLRTKATYIIAYNPDFVVPQHDDVICVSRITWPTAIVKTRYVLSITKEAPRVRKLLAEDLIGEISRL